MSKEILVDEEIILKRVAGQDAQTLFDIIDTQREYLGKWLPFVEKTKVVDQTQAVVKTMQEQPEESMNFVYTMQYLGEIVGLIGFKDTDTLNRKTEIGYWLSEDFQKKGIVTRSVRAMCNFAFVEKNINRVQIKCAIENIPSQAIPKRLGFVMEGTERDGELLAGGGFTDLYIYSKLRSEAGS
jgi:ribosomal-protein-serine acetyltransferase